MKTCKNLLLSNLAMKRTKETKQVFNLMIDSAQNQEKEIDPSNNEEEEKTAMDPLKEYLIIRKKENTCYHCEKRFKAKLFPYILLEAVILIVLCMTVNIILLNRMQTLDLIALFAVTVGFIVIIVLLIPFFTKFKKVEESGTKENRRIPNKKKTNKK